MIRLRRFNLRKIEAIFKKLPRSLAENAFLAFLGLLSVALILGAIIFYQYIVLAMRGIPEVIEKPLEFDKETYQIILNEWKTRTERFSEVDLKEHLDPFNP